ncbi:hypothetical protein [Streptomyces capitiformicae]|uniref:Uncharacterized protein n=1 Tax=Streptomyces capitiformicae TaxID=2014920 RepID=A0A918ZRB3_9ACTN|nr:hypothetical protein [Streptomyces capitiformicae]GHE64572.1 hypothetical protein GCM10017771_88050 [Streptomyces capitiformicae]
MHLVSRALAWVRALLFGPPEIACRAPLGVRADTAQESRPSPPVRQPSPETWAPFLAGARRRGTSCASPRTGLPPITPDDIGSTLVGAYLLTSEVRQQIRQARQFVEVS